ncbi:MAG: asparaginase [Hyphomicrobiaceae bacterium]|nr:asparaginase [Hyphomicrobiaceae bacterium]
MTNPVLIEVTRGPLVESVHKGAVAVVTAAGATILHIGDVARPVFPRSSIKALQCLPLIESGAADRFGYGNAEIALACASHTGTDRHAALAGQMLASLGLGEADLGCGAHMPLGSSAMKALIRSGREPSQLHNNCSGKHAGMLATALHSGEAAEGYWQASHPVQRRVHKALVELSGLPLGEDVMGLDGCSVPNWAMPLSTLARTFARFVTGHGLSPDRRRAAERIAAACWAEPELVAGPGRADTLVMRRLPGRVFMKTGAEGVYAGGFPEFGVGFALKIDDGTTRASAGAAMALVERIVPEARGLMARKVLRSWRGIEVGEIRTAPALERALERLDTVLTRASA